MKKYRGLSRLVGKAKEEGKKSKLFESKKRKRKRKEKRRTGSELQNKVGVTNTSSMKQQKRLNKRASRDDAATQNYRNW